MISIDLNDSEDGFNVHALPVPNGKDGKPILPSETVYGGDGKVWKVMGIGNPPYSVIADAMDWDGMGARPRKELKPGWLTHEPPETWERIYKDVQEAAIGVSDMKKRAGDLYWKELNDKLWKSGFAIDWKAL